MNFLEFEALSDNARLLANAADAVHTAMTECGSTADTFVDALLLVTQGMRTHSNDLKRFFEENRSHRATEETK
ncbi:MAG: hypothetical protein LBJ11_09045 [Oscillospiraceae bacterium]|jgi:hypothetical protein|nr:hypothetical protein [Oscillospiraceae bacterium]